MVGLQMLTICGTNILNYTTRPIDYLVNWVIIWVNKLSGEVKGKRALDLLKSEIKKVQFIIVKVTLLPEDIPFLFTKF